MNRLPKVRRDEMEGWIDRGLVRECSVEERGVLCFIRTYGGGMRVDM